jgi:hypothetical protein
MPDHLTEAEIEELRVLKAEIDGIITRYEEKGEDIPWNELQKIHSKLSAVLQPFSERSERG